MPWKHETLIAPFNFSILKTDAEIKSEKDSLLKNYLPYFSIDSIVLREKTQAFRSAILSFADSLRKQNQHIDTPKLIQVFEKYYRSGILAKSPDSYPELAGKKGLIRVYGNKAERVPIDSICSMKSAYQNLIDTFKILTGKHYPDFTSSIRLNDYIAEDLHYDELINQNELNRLNSTISLASGMVQAGERIIFQGDLVGPREYQILESLKRAYETRRGDNFELLLVIIGKIIIISSCFLLLFLYLLYYRREIFDHKRKLTFILFMVVLMSFLAGFAGKSNHINIYVIPMAILPILVRIFFDSRTAIYTLMATTLLIGYFAPNNYEYMLLQIVAGIVSVFSLNKLHRRSHLVFTAIYVFIAYASTYLALSLVQEGNLQTINWNALEWFGTNALLVLLAYPLIYIFEKIFGFVSDVTLMELSNTSSQPLLRKLAKEAPGTFQHSQQVANLAQAVIQRIGGNPLLVYTGALYHDIGKTANAEYFIENQAMGMNPHDRIDHKNSASIIINHVNAGVKLARKYKLPEVLISFITTHHGTTQANYFYKMYQNENPESEIDIKDFTYPGPLPHSKETSVVMIIDGIEAASRSLKEKTHESLKELIENMVEQKIKSGQLQNAELTFRDISILKATLLDELINVYHARIAYPK
jgi:hypothetical protein